MAMKQLEDWEDTPKMPYITKFNVITAATHEVAIREQGKQIYNLELAIRAAGKELDAIKNVVEAQRTIIQREVIDAPDNERKELEVRFGFIEGRLKKIEGKCPQPEGFFIKGSVPKSWSRTSKKLVGLPVMLNGKKVGVITSAYEASFSKGYWAYDAAVDKAMPELLNGDVVTIDFGRGREAQHNKNQVRKRKVK